MRFTGEDEFSCGADGMDWRSQAGECMSEIGAVSLTGEAMKQSDEDSEVRCELCVLKPLMTPARAANAPVPCQQHPWPPPGCLCQTTNTPPQCSPEGRRELRSGNESGFSDFCPRTWRSSIRNTDHSQQNDGQNTK